MKGDNVMRILHIGAGMIGSVIAKDIMKKHSVTVLDGKTENLDLINEENQIKCVLGDVTDKQKLSELIAENDIISIALPGRLAIEVVRESLAQKKITFDISSIPNNVLLGELCSFAKKQQTLYVPKIGIAPGMTNFLCGRGAALLDDVADIEIYVGGIPERRVSPMDYKTVFCLPETLQEYVDPAEVVVGGKTEYKEALSGLHEVYFEGFEGLEAFITDGLATLPKTLKAKNMTEYTIRWSGHAKNIRNLIEMGFFETKEENYKGASFSPREYLISRLAPLWEMKIERGDSDATLFRIIVRGQKNGHAREYTWEMIDKYDTKRGITSMAKCTAFTCATFIDACAEGMIKAGEMVFPEILAKDDKLYSFIMSELSKKGVPFKEQTALLEDF